MFGCMKQVRPTFGAVQRILLEEIRDKCRNPAKVVNKALGEGSDIFTEKVTIDVLKHLKSSARCVFSWD